MSMQKTIGVPFLLVAAGFVPAAAQAATVRAVSPAKNMVALDTEEGETPVKGDTFCITGPKKKPIDCGKVVKIKGTVAIISLATPGKIGKIKKGMRATNSGGGAAAAPSDSSGDAATAAVASKGGGTKLNPVRFWLLMDPAMSSPFTYKQITYQAVDGTAKPTTLWAPGKAPGLALASFGGQLGFPLGKKAVNLGGRMRTFSPPSSVDTDYTTNVQNPYANTVVSAKAFGGWLDYQLVHSNLSSSTFFNFLTGLDLDYSTVTVTATKKNDNAPDSGSIVTATSKLMVISLRLGANFDVFFTKSFGITIGGTAMLPLLPMSANLAASFPEGEDRGVADAVADLKGALGHKKNGIALEALASAFIAF